MDVHSKTTTARTQTGTRMLAAAMLILATAFLTIPATFSSATAQDLAIPPRYEAVGHFHEGLAPALEGGKWGFIDRSGNWVVQPTYESVYRGADGRFGIKQDGLWGYIATSGDVVIEPKYKEIRAFNEGVARVREADDAWFFIFPDGTRESDITFLDASDRADGLSMVKIKADYGTPWMILNPRGAPFDVWGLPQKDLKGFHAFSEGFARGITDAGVVYVDAEGKTLFDGNPILGGRDFSEGLAAGSDGRKWGYFDKDAKTVIGLGLDGARDFSQGVAPAALGNKWGYVNKQGSTAYPPELETAYSFRESYATIKKDGKFGFAHIDEAGKITIAIEPQYEDVYGFQEGLAPVLVDGKWGFIAAEVAEYSLVRGIGELTPN
ncbi:WG repeat-containing protein [Tepidamorphus sp. 3E244]|uniref:WG repeat-containing protein n=1 Tax=Tepidamorphus sp. 3E244 TaxID=3385498 RepID=UPI0038FC72D5